MDSELTAFCFMPNLESKPLAKPNKDGLGSYVHTRVISEQRSNNPRRAITRSERAGARLQTRRTLQNLATEIGETELADKVCRCHANLAVVTCGKHIEKIIPDYVCGFRLCPDCGRRRSARLLRNYLPAVVAYPMASGTQAVHLVLTQAQRRETLSAAVKRITKNFKTLRRRAFWNDHFKGGLFAVEFTISKDGLYHAHLHILAFRRRFFDVQILKDLWLEITGDSSNLRLDRINANDLISGLREVLKYAVKPASIADFTADHLRDFMAMKGQRMFGTFGEFQKFARTYEPPAELPALLTGLDLGPGSPCSHCGEALFDVRVKGKDLPEFIRRMESSIFIKPEKSANLRC